MSELTAAPVQPAQQALSSLLEAILFIAAEPLSLRQLAVTLDVTPGTVEQAMRQLSEHYTGRGIQLQHSGDTFQFVTAPTTASAVAHFLGIQPSGRLSGAALEVLAIIAYRQPVTRAQVEAVRGVDSSATLRVLLARDLILEVGRLEAAGRPILYGTGPAFLQYFGLTDLAQLPPLDHV